MICYLITGTSRGLGEALAGLCLDQGAMVIGISRSENPRLSEAAVRSGSTYHHMVADLTEMNAIEGLVDRALALVEEAAVTSLRLINNAGALEPIAPIEEVEAAELDTHIRTNLTAVALLTGMFLKKSASRNVARTVVNITSGAASKPYRGWSAYCATKAGLDMLTRVTAEEQGSRTGGARIIGVAPGVVETEMQRTIRSSDPERFPDREKFVNLKESGELSAPADAARLVLRAIEDPEVTSGDIIDVRSRYSG